MAGHPGWRGHATMPHEFTLSLQIKHLRQRWTKYAPLIAKGFLGHCLTPDTSALKAEQVGRSTGSSAKTPCSTWSGFFGPALRSAGRHGSLGSVLRSHGDRHPSPRGGPEMAKYVLYFIKHATDRRVWAHMRDYPGQGIALWWVQRATPVPSSRGSTLTSKLSVATAR
jgi:hypothetical protein